MNILVFNPGGNSLKVELVNCREGQSHAFDGTKRLSVSIENIGKKDSKLSTYEGKSVIHSEPVEAMDYADAAEKFFSWMSSVESRNALHDVECVGIRVVHGGAELSVPTRIDSTVRRKIEELEKLAPLHNKSSLEVLDPINKHVGHVPIIGVFDTGFHRTIPDHAGLYAIPPELAKKHQIRRYGFHGISHQYMLERYAHLAGRPVERCSVVSMHLESGCSVTAVKNGKSVDNTMGLTPLEGLMMGTRSGDVDPSLAAVLMREEGMGIDEVMELLNKKSGLLAVSGESLDTRELIKHIDTNPRVRLALEMFSYRVRKAVGAYLAVLGGADAVIFGGGIAENTEFVREYVSSGLRWCGLDLDEEANHTLIDKEGRLSTPQSTLEAWVIPVEEGLQIAHECLGAMTGSSTANQAA